jgi:hypothetical protein
LRCESDGYLPCDNSSTSGVNTQETHGHEDRVEDVFDELKNLRRKHPLQFMCAYLNINSLRYKFCLIEELLTSNNIDEVVLLVNIHFPCLLKLSLYTFFIIWQNILLIHILTILCLCLLPVIPRPSTSINTCLLVTRFPLTVVLTYNNYGGKFAVQ